MRIVLDTCALLYWTLEPTKLSDEAVRCLKEASEILVSSISIWEIGLKIKQQKLTIPMSAEAYADEIARVSRVRIVPVDSQNWLENVRLDWDHRDPADRTVVALANLNESQLVTSDRKILDFYSRAIW